MKVLAREGNTLSPVIRNAWDGKTLQTMAKNSPLRATGAHVGIVGHITKQELLRHITATELANGFFNRFMVVAVQRSKTLPFGGRLGGEDLDRVRQQVRLAARFAAIEQQITFDAEARERWIAAYDELSRGEAGLAGAATARADAHTVRLALIYALLDCSDVIGLEHLEAALAFWAYSAASARWVFGDSIGDPTADEIWSLACERHDGITRTEVSNLFSRNKKAREIDRALQALIDAGRLERATIRDPGHRAFTHDLAPARRAGGSLGLSVQAGAGADLTRVKRLARAALSSAAAAAPCAQQPSAQGSRRRCSPPRAPLQPEARWRDRDRKRQQHRPSNRADRSGAGHAATRRRSTSTATRSSRRRCV